MTLYHILPKENEFDVPPYPWQSNDPIEKPSTEVVDEPLVVIIKSCERRNSCT